MHVCTPGDRPGLTGMGARGRGAHKTKQEMTKHLALLASLGRLGLSEHMVQLDLEWQEPGGVTECEGRVACRLTQMGGDREM